MGLQQDARGCPPTTTKAHYSSSDQDPYSNRLLSTTVVTMAPLQFNCDSCTQSIAPTNPRVHCLVCADYDLCANCALGERFTTGHVAGHGTQVFKQSGGNGQQAIPASTTPAQSALNTPLGHPGSPGRPSGVPPPLPSRPSNTQRAPNSAGGGSAGWQPWFHPDSSPTDAYITLMNDIFTHLDPTNVGNLVPETFSGFLDDLGYLTHENACTSLHPAHDPPPLS